MEEEDVRPVPRMRGEDSEARGGERRGQEDPERQPPGQRAQLTEDGAAPCASRVDRDEREGRATPQPNDHACDMQRHEQAVTTHLVSFLIVDSEDRAAGVRSNPPRRQPDGRSRACNVSLGR